MIQDVLIVMVYLSLVSWQYQSVSDLSLNLLLILTITIGSQEYKDDDNFRKFHRQIFHSSLHHILFSLHPHMLVPRVTQCSDGHFRRVIYGIGPYIADYPEQALLACIVQGWCPRYVEIKNLSSCIANANPILDAQLILKVLIVVLDAEHINILIYYLKNGVCKNFGIIMELLEILL